MITDKDKRTSRPLNRTLVLEGGFPQVDQLTLIRVLHPWARLT